MNALERHSLNSYIPYHSHAAIHVETAYTGTATAYLRKTPLTEQGTGGAGYLRTIVFFSTNREA